MMNEHYPPCIKIYNAKVYNQMFRSQGVWFYFGLQYVRLDFGLQYVGLDFELQYEGLAFGLESVKFVLDFNV